MKVKDLIEELKKYDGELKVMIDGKEGGLELLTPSQIWQSKAIYVREREYMGSYEDIEYFYDDEEMLPSFFGYVCLSRHEGKINERI